MKRVLHLIILIILPVGLYANPIIGAISIDNYGLRSESGELYIDIDISLSPLDFAPNERVVITPTIQADGGERLQLPDIVVGRRGALISHLREVEPTYGKGLWSEPQGVIRVSRRYGSQYSYSFQVEGEEWMQSGDLLLSSRYINCGDMGESTLLATIYQHDALPSESVDTPYNQEDLVESVVVAESTTTLSLLFQRGESTLNLDYASNREVAQLLNSLISSGDVEELLIVGYASPQGEASLNNLLSKHRALSVERYIRGESGSLETITTQWYGEDWEQLSREVSSSGLPQSGEIVDVINSSTRDDLREEELKSLGRELYNYISNEIYPSLQRVEVVVIK